ncbi:MAG: PrsW family glutamic-type intramembrane protease [Prolixibacteraceae bacterium]|nr:PrsW family glutamic-type intramembrane protease [Prolixibacteraceae bacterium]
MEIITISLAPVAIIAFYIWSCDKYEREPVKLILTAMLLGAAIAVPVVFVEHIISQSGSFFTGAAASFWNAFVVAAFTEESFKFLVLWLLILKSPEFNDKYDGIVYATFVSLGFAGVENILYVADSGYVTGLMRAFTAVPAHAIFGITMGFYFGMAKFYPYERRSLKAKSLLIPILLHGIYDFILMTETEWLWIVFIGFVIFLYTSGFKRIKTLSRHSYFRTDFDLLNEKFNRGD